MLSRAIGGALVHLSPAVYILILICSLLTRQSHQHPVGVTDQSVAATGQLNDATMLAETANIEQSHSTISSLYLPLIFSIVNVPFSLVAL